MTMPSDEELLEIFWDESYPGSDTSPIALEPNWVYVNHEAGIAAVKRAVMAGLGIAMVSRLTVEEDLASRRVAPVRITTGLPAREFVVVDHPHKHHGAACRAMLQLLERTFPMHGAPPRPRKAP